MNTFVNGAMQTPDSLTENGAQTFSTSLDFHTDLFFTIGASRGKVDRVMKTFESAFKDDPVLAIRLGLWGRDVRGGAGEREIFRAILKYLDQHVEMNRAFLEKITEVGRFDDLLVLEKNFGVATKYIKDTIENSYWASDKLKNLDNLSEDEVDQALQECFEKLAISNTL